MTTSLPTKIALSTFAALTLAGSLVACSSPAPTDNSGTGVDTGDDNISNLESSDTPYNDGTYDASGEYESPAGTESLDVTITLADDIITDVTVVGSGGNPDVERYQGEFIAGVADVVVGQDIDELVIDRVAGSSLSSNGFKAALRAIKAEALA